MQIVNDTSFPPPGWVDRDGACRMLGISRSVWKRWCIMGRVGGGIWSSRGRGRCKIYPVEEIERLVKEEAKQALVLKETVQTGDCSPAEGYVTRDEACRIFGVGKTTWKRWENAGHVPRGEFAKGGRERSWRRVYSLDVLNRVMEQFANLGQPYPDPDRSGCYLVPVMSFRTTKCEAIIDAADLPQVLGKRWNWIDREDGYDGAVILASCEDSKTPMRHIILGLDTSQWRISHVNRDPLDHRRANLVVRNMSQHSHRARKIQMRSGEPCTSRFKGVCWEYSRKRWRAMIKKDAEWRYLGRFRDEIAAAEAYDKAARELFGEHARLNFPDDNSDSMQTRKAA